MQHSPSWQANSSSASREIPRILRNSKVHYRIHNSQPLVPILRQIDAVHVLLSYSLRSLLPSPHLCLRLPNGLFPSGFSIKPFNHTRWFKYDRDKLWLVYTQIVPVIFKPPCISLLSHACHIARLPYSLLYDHRNNISWRTHYTKAPH